MANCAFGWRIWLPLALLLASSVQAKSPRELVVDVASDWGKLDSPWAWFGYEQANATFLRDGSQLLAEISKWTKAPRYIRAHNLLTSGDGTTSLRHSSTNVYSEDKSGKPRYDWQIVDRIVDTYVRLGLTPVMEMGFMPRALSSHPEPYLVEGAATAEHAAGWFYPPKSYEKWGKLISRWVQHSLERYGRQRVETWLWQPWNEPDGEAWHGSFGEFITLYDHSTNAVKRACPRCKVGGPHTTNPNVPRARAALRSFLEHCDSGVNAATGMPGAPLDFVAFHATGEPKIVGKKVQMNLRSQLQAVNAGFGLLASFSKFEHLPVVVGAFDPDSCAACSPRENPQYAYRLDNRYPAYLAASHARVRQMARQQGVNLIGVITSSFEFEGQRYFDGLRALATHGIHKPALGFFEMLSKMPLRTRLKVRNPGMLSLEEISMHGVRGPVSDLHAIASRDKKRIAVLIWNYHDKQVTVEPQKVSLSLQNVAFTQVTSRHYRLDAQHGNARALWKKMGSPQAPTAEHLLQLKEAGQLQLLSEEQRLEPSSRQLTLSFLLPRHSVSLILFNDAS